MNHTISFDEQGAQKLAEQFKKHGYLDRLKKEILSSKLEQDTDSADTKTFEDSVKEQVKSMVKEMVREDENLIFKNRGTTTALIESKMLKDYKLLEDNQSGIDIKNYIEEKLKNPKMHDDIRKNVENLYDEKGVPGS
ncbi:similar to Saccharomyces cerevisiae YBR258C SHG1 Subunit of the COMPASS (Set1C) complex [Maudiozyma saulgeensis]|uniref:Similar to Saccharomyces cerevisiae YBR258C SHG1 Subunit of the COMPASS (Set1C) complex n=1 Tax=Maudiozyma saulgeensis TaxID=1789683 RepID=A0A1X7R0M3_9SACH|nr:similar to Saccharomyces cerevisiae YBR258C SHG1 Subunit of the COMPASS (Set1C) complex [Kazachstania saulgeensis]